MNMAAEKFAIPKDIINYIQFESKKDNFSAKYDAVEAGICRDDYTKCMAIKRIIKMLKFYHNNHDNYGEISKYLQDYKQYLISDYHHVLSDHLNEDKISKTQSDQEFKWIYDQLNSTANNDMTYKNTLCDIGECKIYSRNNRDRAKINIDCDDEQLSMFIDIMDTIHCYFLHSVDIGYRILHSSNDELKENDNDVYTASDTEMKQLRSYLLSRRQKLQKLRGDQRFRNNKFMTNLSS